MLRWLGILIGTLRSAVRTHRELALENLALRQQLAVWKACRPAATPDGSGPDLLGRAIQVLEELAEFPADGEAGDRGEVAAGVPALLGVEESTPMRSARD
jgi:hypothetical protein